MKIVRIFLLYLQNSFERRLRNLIWFIHPIANNLTVVIFWFGALKSSAVKMTGWSFSSLASYYFIMTTLGSILAVYIEQDISEDDIKQGRLVFYLLKPFSYYWTVFIDHLGYKSVRLFLIAILLAIFYFSVGNIFKITDEPVKLIFALIISILGLFIIFTLKFCLGLTSFWFKENRSLFELFEIVNIIFSGGIVPLDLFPKNLQLISYSLPFSYCGYFPIISFQGKLEPWQSLRIIGVQFIWIAVFYGLYKLLWNKGVKEFTATGQ